MSAIWIWIDFKTWHNLSNALVILSDVCIVVSLQNDVTSWRFCQLSPPPPPLLSQSSKSTDITHLSMKGMIGSAENDFSFFACVHRRSTYFLECVFVYLWVRELELQVFIFGSGLLLCHHKELSPGIRPVPRTSLIPSFPLSLSPSTPFLPSKFSPKSTEQFSRGSLKELLIKNQESVIIYSPSRPVCWYFSAEQRYF